MSTTASKRRTRAGARKADEAFKGGPSMAHVGFLGARHMHPERCPSDMKETTAALRLFDTAEDTLHNVEKQSQTVKILMVNGLCLKQLNNNLVERMLLLEKLDLSENQLGDASLPEAFKKLEHLVELNLSNNKFTKIPVAVKKLKNLSRFSMSHNNVESLKGLEKQKKMKILLIDHNKFTSVFKDVSHMRKLEILDCSYNSIREVGLDIRYLKNLRELNISKNRISVLPTDVFQLTTLESLKASQNQISKVPVFNMNPQHCHCLSEIDLSGNVINKFPAHLLTISKKLDLATNRIKTLEYDKMKKLGPKTDKELSIDGNPVSSPPPDVCECGLGSIMQYFQEEQLDMKVYQGLKILVLGAPQSGKTSFVQTLVDGQPRLSEEMYEKSAGIELSDMVIDDVPDTTPPPTLPVPTSTPRRKTSIKKHSITHAKIDSHLLNGHGADADDRGSTSGKPQKRSLNMCIWDFCGHSFYLYPHYMFFEQPAVAILTFNMHTYKSEDFERVISSWFDWMIAKTNKVCVLLVGTHADKMKKDHMKEVCTEVLSKLQAHAERQRQIVKKRIDAITEKPHISQTLSSQLNAYSMLLQEKFVVQSEVIITSAAKNTGYETVTASIEMLAKDARQFPNVLRQIPTFWSEVETYMEDKGNTMVVPVMKYDDLKEEIGEKYGMKHLISTIVQYLHETGKALWFANNPAMKGFVILRPAWFFDIFRAVFRHDLVEKLDIEVEDSFRTIGITQGKYDLLKEEFLAEGVADRDLLKCMFSQLLPLETNGPFLEVINILMEHLDLGYLVAKNYGTGYNLNPGNEGMFSRKYLIPWFRKVPEPDCVQDLWAPLEKHQRLAGVCRFPKYMPPGLFEMLSVRAHRDKHKLRFLSHWDKGFHARHKVDKLQVLFRFYDNEEDAGTTLRFELRDDTQDANEDPVSGAAMWTVLLPLLMDLEELLHAYTGVLVERLMECPNCKLLTFIGEWLTPKETQGMATRPCEECNDNIDSAFLVQPREKKRDDVRYNLARLRMKKRDALKGSDDSQRPMGMSIQSNVRTGRRVALLPMENVTVGSRHGSLSDTNDSDLDESKSRRQSHIATLPGLTEEEMVTFRKGTGQHGDGSNGSEEADTPFPAFGEMLPGLDASQMASFLSKHLAGNGNATGINDANDHSDDEDADDEDNSDNDVSARKMTSRGGARHGHAVQQLPGLSADQMASFLQNHQNGAGDDTDEESENEEH